jgi:hypothetical protein
MNQGLSGKSMPQINVLSLDGGGVRGIITSRLLELFCTLAGIPADKIYQYFNIISGTSIGGIQALGYAKGLTPSYVKQLLINNASTIFNCTYPIPGGGQASYGTWTGYLTGVYSSLYSQPPLKTNVLVPAFKRFDSNGKTVNVPIYFSNISSSIVPYFSGQAELAANVALATSAAPVYFLPAVFNGESYVDGGIFLNNPAALALSAQKAIQPAINKFCVLSIGTGLGSIGYIPGEPTLKGAIDNLNTIKMVLDVSMAIPPEGVAVEQKILSNYALENLYYLRLQYPIDLSQEPDSSLDNSDSEFIQYMQDSATQYFNDNIESITNFIGHLFS